MLVRFRNKFSNLAREWCVSFHLCELQCFSKISFDLDLPAEIVWQARNDGCQKRNQNYKIVFGFFLSVLGASDHGQNLTVFHNGE